MIKFNNIDRFKFRAWDKIIMYYDISPNFANNTVKIDIGNFNNETFEMKLKDLVIMQCVGIKDKNKTLIYENDIVNFGDNYPSIVKYGCVDGESIGFYLYENKPKKGEGGFYPRFHSIGYLNSNIEVLGNIYENKKLLNSMLD